MTDCTAADTFVLRQVFFLQNGMEMGVGEVGRDCAIGIPRNGDRVSGGWFCSGWGGCKRLDRNGRRAGLLHWFKILVLS